MYDTEGGAHPRVTSNLFLPVPDIDLRDFLDEVDELLEKVKGSLEL